MRKDEIMSRLKEIQKLNGNGHNGKLFAYIYETLSEEHDEVLRESYCLFMHENGLNPTVFPGLKRY